MCTPIRIPARRGFTLIELIVVIAIIGLLFITLMGAMYSAQDTARRSRSQQIIGKLHQQVSAKWDEYMVRRPLVDPTQALNFKGVRAGDALRAGSSTNWRLLVARQKLGALREQMRCEMPDNYFDISLVAGSKRNLQYLVTPQGTPYVPRASLIYQTNIGQAPRRTVPPGAASSFDTQAPLVMVTHASAECLYMAITLNSEDLDSTALSVSVPETSDNDYDGMREFNDGWGNPIYWIRWPSGFVSEVQPMYSVPTGDPRAGGMQPSDPNQPANKLTRDPVSNHDTFDVLNVDRWEPVTPPTNWKWSWQGKPEFGYNLFPLIVSGGTDFDPNTNSGMGLVFAVPTNQPVLSDPFDLSNPASPYWLADQDGNRLGSIVHPSANNNVHNQMTGSRP